MAVCSQLSSTVACAAVPQTLCVDPVRTGNIPLGDLTCTSLHPHADRRNQNTSDVVQSAAFFAESNTVSK